MLHPFHPRLLFSRPNCSNMAAALNAPTFPACVGPRLMRHVAAVPVVTRWVMGNSNHALR